MPRFVILEHDYPILHWDFMLETSAGLRTWRLAMAPTPDRVIGAVPLGLHRAAYLDYEGPVSGNRGTVTRWDGGHFEEIVETEDKVQVRLRGHRVSGMVTLERAGEDWTFRLIAD